MDQPLISIIVPIFNTALYLEECLKSIVAQSYTHWEAILIDDCSTDGKSLFLCNKWAEQDERFRIIALPENKGISYVRNKGLSLIQGSLVTFVDSDDFLDSNHLSSLFETLNESDCSIATTGIRQRYSDGKFRKRILGKRKGFQWSTKEALKTLLMNRHLTNHLCNKLYDKKLFEGLSFPEGRVYEDVAISVSLIERSAGVVHTGGHTYNYRRHNASITRKKSIKNSLDFFQVYLERYQYLLKENALLTAQERAMLQLWYRKKLLQLTHDTYKMMPSDERNAALSLMQQQLKSLGLSEIHCCYSWKMLFFSLQKRYYEQCL